MNRGRRGEKQRKRSMLTDMTVHHFASYLMDCHYASHPTAHLSLPDCGRHMISVKWRTWGCVPFPSIYAAPPIPPPLHPPISPPSPYTPPTTTPLFLSSLAMFARARALEGGTLMAWSQMAATRQATWRRATKGAHIHTHPFSITHSHFLPLMNSHELFITHTCALTHTLTRLSQGTYTAPVSNRRLCDFSLFYYHFSRHFPWL